MRQADLDIFARRAGRGLLAATLTFALWQVWIDPPASLAGAPILAGLAAAAALTAFPARAAGEPASSGFAMTFALPAPILLPGPGGLLVALALIVGGPQSGSPPHMAGVAVAFAVGQLVVDSWSLVPGTLTAFIALAALFAFATVLGLALELTMGARRVETPPRARWRTLALDALAVPLGWVLLSALDRQSWLEVAAVAAVAFAGAAIRLKLDRALSDLRSSNRALESRNTELATLHAIGREIVSSLEPNRVFGMIERECRKIFRVDYCVIAIATDEREMRSAYRRRRGGNADTDEADLGPLPLAWAEEEKRPLRVDDLEACPPPGPLASLVDEGVRSIMVAPLIVEDRTIGLLSIQSRLPGAYDDHLLAVLSTIAQQAAVAIENARHYQQATLDSLTGFHSRDYFFRRLEEEHRRIGRYGGQFALLMIDLDGFKLLNDRHGHLAGDLYLRSVGDAIRQQLRDADLPCRYGGDEFCILLPETDLQGGGAIAERIRDAVSAHIVESEGQVLRTTASIGVAAFPEHGARVVRELLQKADEALYRAKSEGRDRVVPFAA